MHGNYKVYMDIRGNFTSVRRISCVHGNPWIYSYIHKNPWIYTHPCVSTEIHGFTHIYEDTIEIPGKAWVWQWIQDPRCGSEARLLGMAVKPGQGQWMFLYQDEPQTTGLANCRLCLSICLAEWRHTCSNSLYEINLEHLKGHFFPTVGKILTLR